ncbi:MAG: hypothetical protein AAF570_00235 [Bacteroidota bacterium]
MKRKNIYLLIAGLVNLFTAFVHLLAGQSDLVSPLLESNLTLQARTEWLGAWHMISIILFASALYLLRAGLVGNRGQQQKSEHAPICIAIGVVYILISLPHAIASLAMWTFAPQWILLLPIGVLTLMGLRRAKTVSP